MIHRTTALTFTGALLSTVDSTSQSSVTFDAMAPIATSRAKHHDGLNNITEQSECSEFKWGLQMSICSNNGPKSDGTAGRSTTARQTDHHQGVHRTPAMSWRSMKRPYSVSDAPFINDAYANSCS